MSNEVSPIDSEIDEERVGSDDSESGMDEAGKAEPSAREIDRDIDRDFETCLRCVEELRDLKISSFAAYKDSIRVLQAFVRGEIDAHPSATSAMVETILSELGELRQSCRPEIKAVLTVADEPAVADEPEDPEKDDEFMGNPNFVRVEEAVRDGKMPEDYYR